MIQGKKFEKGTLGWLKERAKKDGFDNIRDWQNWKRRPKIKNIYQIEQIFKDREDFYRFWSRVDIKDNKEDCWNWTSSTDKWGYGTINMISHYETNLAHRMAYILTKGYIPDNKCVMHICNNPKCCNPNHLKLGNSSENMQYMFRCGRLDRRGEHNSQAKLTEVQVIQIHKSFAERRRQFPKLKRWQVAEPIAKKYKTTDDNILQIINGTTWCHIYKVLYEGGQNEIKP